MGISQTLAKLAVAHDTLRPEGEIQRYLANHGITSETGMSKTSIHKTLTRNSGFIM